MAIEDSMHESTLLLTMLNATHRASVDGSARAEPQSTLVIICDDDEMHMLKRVNCHWSTNA